MSARNRSRIKFPFSCLLKIQGVLIRELLAIPECYNKNGDAIYIIGKDGNTTDFTVTVGRIFAMSLVDSLSR